MLENKTMLALAGVYSFYDRELSEFAIEVWSDALGDLDQQAVRAAFQRHLKDPDSGRFLPKPADILRQLHGDTRDQALIAWGDVLKRATEADYWQEKTKVSDVALQAVYALGGWSAIGRADMSQNGFLQKQFVDLFQAYQRRADTQPLLESNNVHRLPGKP